MKQYNPDIAIDPEVWNEIDEGERIDLIEQYHTDAKIELPSLAAHACIHVAIENQIALDDEFPTAKTLERLMNEGLDRHDALHAIGSLLAVMIFDLQSGMESDLANEKFFEGIQKLTAEKWRQSAEE